MATKFNKQALLDKLDARIADTTKQLETEQKAIAEAAKPTTVKRSDDAIVKDWKAACKSDFDNFMVKAEAAFRARSHNVDDYLRGGGGMYRGYNVHASLSAPNAPEQAEADAIARAHTFQHTDHTTKGQLARLNKQRELLLLMGTDKDGNVSITISANNDFAYLLRDILNVTGI
jgi:hypothetical protein